MELIVQKVLSDAADWIQPLPAAAKGIRIFHLLQSKNCIEQLPRIESCAFQLPQDESCIFHLLQRESFIEQLPRGGSSIVSSRAYFLHREAAAHEILLQPRGHRQRP